MQNTMMKPTTPAFHYDRETQLSPLQLLKTSRQGKISTPKGFGKAEVRFPADELFPVPGVGKYDIDKPVSNLLIETPSFSHKGYNSFLSKSPKTLPLFDNEVPGPCAYDVQSFSLISPKKGNSTAFIPSGDGRVPFPKPNNYPGPSDYFVKFDGGKSPFLLNKKSASFTSLTKRDSFFDKQSPAPGPAKYDVKVVGKSFNNDLNWSRSTFGRFDDVGKDNEVPSPSRYFDDRVDYIEEKKMKSLRSIGNFRGAFKGKQNEKRKEGNTFGADKDRFKNSVFGRLDLAALIPAPGHYDDIFRNSANKGKGRTLTAGKGLRTNKLNKKEEERPATTQQIYYK